jgi:hypothetical protein
MTARGKFLGLGGRDEVARRDLTQNWKDARENSAKDNRKKGKAAKDIARWSQLQPPKEAAPVSSAASSTPAPTPAPAATATVSATVPAYLQYGKDISLIQRHLRRFDERWMMGKRSLW